MLCMKKILILALSIAFLGSSLSQSAFAAVKAGAKCTTLGQQKVAQSKKFTCVSKSKKLVWSKGIPFAKPAVAPTIEPPMTTENVIFPAWTTKFESSVMTQAALNKTDAYFGKVSPSNTYEITIDPALSESDKAWITKSLDYANGSFSNLNREKLKVVLGTSHEWGRSSLRKQNIWVGDPLSPFPCSDGSRDAYCADQNVVLLVYSDMYATNSTYRWDIGRQSTPAHEVFHTIQSSLNAEANPNFVNGKNLAIPRWLMEGSANFYGYYVNEKLGFGSYQAGRISQIENFAEYKNIMPLSDYGSFNNLNPYGIGQAATEYLIASAGFEALLNIFRYTASENGFEAGFNKATGITLAEFYSKFGDARSSMKIGG
jgi:hypothetical protein